MAVNSSALPDLRTVTAQVRGVNQSTPAASPAARPSTEQLWDDWHRQQSSPSRPRITTTPPDPWSEYRRQQSGYSADEWRRLRARSAAGMDMPLNLQPRPGARPASDPWSEYRRQQSGYSPDEWRQLRARAAAGMEPPLNLQPRSSAGRPLNQTASPPGGLSTNPGRQVNPTGGRFTSPSRPINAQAAGGAAAASSIWGIGAAASVAMNGGGFFETTWTGVGTIAGGGIGGALGAAGGAAAGAGLGTVTFPVVGTITGAGALGTAGGIAGGAAGGTIGQKLGQPIGKAIDDLIPDVSIPKPAWVPDWAWPGDEEEYPNEFPPDAAGNGSKLTEGTPAVAGEAGSVAGATYNITWTIEAYPSWAPQTNIYTGFIGPISSSTGTTTYSPGYYKKWKRFTAANKSIELTVESTFSNGVIQFRNGQGGPIRADGGTDPPASPEIPPTYAPNPARSSPDGLPRTLPTPAGIDAPNYTPELPWPEVAPTLPPDTQPLAPTLPAPEGFNDTPLIEPNTPTAPGAATSPTDLEAPKAEAPNLQDDPYTPEKPAPLGAKNKTQNEDGSTSYELPDGTKITNHPDGSQTIDSPTDSPWIPQLHSPISPLEVAIPVVLLDGIRQKVNTPSAPNFSPNPAQNPNVQINQPPVQQGTTEGPKGSCFYEFQRVADIQAKATSTNQQASNPVSGFSGLYGVGIESRVKIGESFTLLQSVNDFMRKAWEMTRIQKVLDVLTFIGVMHNVSMLSRDVGDTFFQLITSGVQAAGVRDEEGGVIDVGQVVGNSVEGFLRQVLGSERYDGINEAWNKANRIISSASAIIWSVRSMGDASLDLLEWIGEHTGRIGNALKRWGVVGERAYPWMSEKPRALPKGRRWLNRATGALETVEGSLSVYQQGVSSVIEIQEESQETMEAIDRFSASILDAVPDPWLDNNPVKNAYEGSKAASDGPDVPPSEAQKG